MSTTVRDIIKSSLRSLGAIASGETPTAQEATNALATLNQMLESWSLERLTVFAKTSETFALVPSQQAYTMGPTGDFDTLRPTKIENAYLGISGTAPPFEIPMEIVDADQWADISVKTMPSGLPTKLYAEQTSPLAIIHLWPMPDQANSLILWSTKLIASFASLNDQIELPPGYLRAIRFNLALELAPEYGITPSEKVETIAGTSLANIKQQNITTQLMRADDALVARSGGFNYLTGESS